MADITKRTSPAPKVEGFSAQHCDYLSNGLQAGVALTAGDACYIDTNGRVQKAVSTVIGATGTNLAESKFDGLVPEDFISGAFGVSLYGAGSIWGYAASGLTPGQHLYIGSTAGALNDAMPSATDRPVAKAISSKDIKILR
jgi:hypothetical protein